MQLRKSVTIDDAIELMLRIYPGITKTKALELICTEWKEFRRYRDLAARVDSHEQRITTLEARVEKWTGD